jgi:uncharacterized coiled-coil DUF342 family protein
MEEVQLNVRHNQISVKRRSVLSEIGMLYMKKGKALGFSDREIDEAVKKVVMLSKQIKEVGEQLKIQQEVDFSLVKVGENPVKDKLNELMLRVSTSSEKYVLKNKYNDLVDQGVEALSQIGFFAFTAKNKHFEALPEFRDMKRKFEKVHAEYLESAKQIKEFQVMSRERSQFLIPILTFVLSMKDFAFEKKDKKMIP